MSISVRHHEEQGSLGDHQSQTGSSSRQETYRDVYELGSGASVEEGQNPEVVEWNTDEQEGKSHTD
ncbi:hypothetical protein EJB05_19940, partial [Eragrostis curvula]